MTHLDEALSHIVHVHFYATQVWHEEVRTNCDADPLGATTRCDCVEWRLFEFFWLVVS